MHKSYYTVKPCQNKLLQAKWDQKYYEEHRKKLQDIYPVIDTSAPRTYMHMHLKLKKIRLEEEKLYMIERDNRLLLEKMSNIMRTKGRIDNHNDYETKSLNKGRKERELLRIAKENQGIIQRIIKKQPEYSAQKWRQDWEKNLEYIDSISMYPDNWWIRANNPRKANSVPPLEKQRSEDGKSNNENSGKSKENKKDKKEDDDKKEKDANKKEKKKTKDDKKDEEAQKDNKKGKKKNKDEPKDEKKEDDETKEKKEDDETKEKKEDDETNEKNTEDEENEKVKEEA